MKYYTHNITTSETTDTTIPVWTDSNVAQGTAYYMPIPPMKISWEPKYVPKPSEEKEPMKERTFLMIKPDAFERGLVGEILDLVSQRGLKMVAFKTVQLTPEDCEKHYSHHVGKDFYPKLVEFMTSGPSLAIVFEGDKAANLCRQLIGNSKHPSQVQPGSIRGRYALDFPRNLIHGSDSYEDARRELRIYLNEEEDIYDEHRVNTLRAIYEEKKAEARREYERKIAEGINLGEEAFAPEVLQEGDWVFSRKGMSLIHKVEPLDSEFLGEDSGNYMAIIHEDFFDGWWGRKDTTTTPVGTIQSSQAFSWTNSPLFLVGRDGQFLSKFVSRPIMKEDHKKYVFKEGRWLPIFAKKSQVLTPDYINGTNPFVQIHEDEHGILADVFDTMNQQVMRIYSKDTDTKWRIMLSNGTDVTPPGAQGLSETQAIMRLRKQAQVATGKLTVLLRYGRPYAASYGQNMKWYNLSTGIEYPAIKKYEHKKPYNSVKKKKIVQSKEGGW